MYVTEIAIQRGLKHKVLTKPLFDELRDILFDSFNLDRGRNYHDEKQDEENKHTKLLLYAHKPSGRRVFEGMDGLVDNLSEQLKYQGVDFQMIDDFEGTSGNFVDGTQLTYEDAVIYDIAVQSVF